MRKAFLRDSDAGQRFIENKHVKGFCEDHKKIDEIIYSDFKAECPTAAEAPPIFKTKSGRINRKKVSAWYYQQSETALMDEVRTFIANHTKRTVLANIHDAIIIDKKLSGEQLFDMHEFVRKNTSNPYISLSKTELEPFRSDRRKRKAEKHIDDLDEIARQDVLAAFFNAALNPQ